MCANAHSPFGSPNNLRYLRVWALLKPMELHDLSLARR